MPLPLGDNITPVVLDTSLSNTISILPTHRTSGHVPSQPQGVIGPKVQSLELQEFAIGRGEAAKDPNEGHISKKADKRTEHSTPDGSTQEQRRTLADLLEFESDPELDLEASQMGRKSREPQKNFHELARASSTAASGQNGHANGKMNSNVEMRRKPLSLDSPSQTENLISRESFTLDDEPPATPFTPNPNSSFFDLPSHDRRNFLLLVLLYFLQGIPMGLASGSVPFLLKEHLSYGQIGVFSLASYPYSLKLLWSPIVDAVWSARIGRRKSWILPIQFCSGFGMIYLGGKIKSMMVSAGAEDGSGVWNFTWWWFFLVFLCATQDIAVDGKSKYNPQ